MSDFAECVEARQLKSLEAIAAASKPEAEWMGAPLHTPNDAR